jgi:hypothetical protein
VVGTGGAVRPVTLCLSAQGFDTLYVRKSAFERGAVFPQMLRVTVETVGP